MIQLVFDKDDLQSGAACQTSPFQTYNLDDELFQEQEQNQTDGNNNNGMFGSSYCKQTQKTSFKSFNKQHSFNIQFNEKCSGHNKNQTSVWTDNLLVWFVQDFMMAFQKLSSIKCVRSEFLELSERRKSGLSSVGVLKPNYATRNFQSNSSIDERHLVVADKNQFLLFEAAATIIMGLGRLFLLSHCKINLISQCNDIKFFCKLFISFNLIAESLPQFVILYLIVRSQPVPDVLVLLGGFSGMLRRLPLFMMPFRNCNQVYSEFLYGIFWNAMLWIHKIGKDMFWSVIIYRTNFIITSFLMIWASVLSEGTIFYRVFTFLCCFLFLWVVTILFVFSAMVIDGEVERFLEGRSFITYKKDINFETFAWQVLSSVKRNKDTIQIMLVILAISFFLDSYIRIVSVEYFLLAQVLLLLNLSFYLYGTWGSNNFIDDLLGNIAICENVVSDLIPIEVSKQLQKELQEENTVNGISFRSSDSGRQKKTSKLNLFPKSLIDINQVTQNCKQREQVCDISNFVRHHDCVTVLCMDIVGFTSMSKKIETFNVMCMLNKLYYQLDLLSEKLGVYKIETIGDCYVVAGGLFNQVSQSNGDHADRMLMMGAGIQKIVDCMACQDGKLKVRVGICSGPVTSGIIGKIQKRYCLFGNIIHLANQLEQTCPVNSIQISSCTFAMLSTLLQRCGTLQQQGSYCFHWKQIFQF